MKNYKFLVPIVLTVLFALSIYMLSSNNISSFNEYKGNLENARAKRELEIWVDAEDSYLKALKYDDSLELYLELGEMYLDALLYGKAEDLAKLIVSDYSKEASAYNYAMRVYYINNNIKKCFSLYNEAIAKKVDEKELEEVYKPFEYAYTISSDYDEIGGYSEGIVTYKDDDAWGYANELNQGIKHGFAFAGPFSDGLAPVVTKSGEAYFIDENGNKKVVVPNINGAEYIGITEDDIFVVCKNGSWDFYNVNGDKVFGDYSNASSIGNGYAAVKDVVYWTIVNSSGEQAITGQYEDVLFDEKRVICRKGRLFVKENGAYYMIDTEGKKVTETKFQYADIFHGDGYAAVEIDGKWGFIDTNGEMRISPQYEEAKSFSNGLAAVKKNGRWGYIDLENEMVINLQFEDASDFNAKGGTFISTKGTWQFLSMYKYNYED